MRRELLLRHAGKLSLQEWVVASARGFELGQTLTGTVDESAWSSVLGRNTHIANVAKRVLTFAGRKEGVQLCTVGVHGLSSLCGLLEGSSCGWRGLVAGDRVVGGLSELSCRLLFLQSRQSGCSLLSLLGAIERRGEGVVGASRLGTQGFL